MLSRDSFALLPVSLRRRLDRRVVQLKRLLRLDGQKTARKTIFTACMPQILSGNKKRVFPKGA